MRLSCRHRTLKTIDLRELMWAVFQSVEGLLTIGMDLAAPKRFVATGGIDSPLLLCYNLARVKTRTIRLDPETLIERVNQAQA